MRKRRAEYALLLGKAKIWPDVVDAFNITVKLNVNYGSVEINDDVELRPRAVQHSPKVSSRSAPPRPGALLPPSSPRR